MAGLQRVKKQENNYTLVSVVTFSFSFQILFIWAISFFLLISWAKKSCSIFFIFSNNQLIIIFTFFLFSISFISALVSIISCHWLVLELVCSFFRFIFWNYINVQCLKLCLVPQTACSWLNTHIMQWFLIFCIVKLE